jgi:hypothetical protein
MSCMTAWTLKMTASITVQWIPVFVCECLFLLTDFTTVSPTNQKLRNFSCTGRVVTESVQIDHILNKSSNKRTSTQYLFRKSLSFRKDMNISNTNTNCALVYFLKTYQSTNTILAQEFSAQPIEKQLT